MTFTYAIGKDNLLEVWNSEVVTEDNAPILRQPHWPDGTSWATKKEAEDWAKAFIALMENPMIELVPGPNPSQPLMPNPALEEKAPE